MGNIATNTIEQIACLKKRGMVLDYEESKIKEYLLDIGYYRLGFYWHPFEIDKNHNFKESTKFSDVIKLYYFDVDLRNLLLKYTSRIEINFRTKVVYYMSNANKTSPTWFADPAIVDQAYISKLVDIYTDKFIKTNRPIKKHHHKYINDRYAPAWKTLEYFTFGNIFFLFKNLKDTKTQQRISEEFGFINLSKFINYIETTVLVRNICAHGDVLFDMKTPKGISIMPNVIFNNRDRSSLDSCLKVVAYLLGAVSLNRKKDLEKQIVEIFDQFKRNPVLKDIIERKANYLY